MKTLTEQHIRLSKQARDQLITLKRYTGASTLNILCRWAYLVSLSDPTPPPIPRQGTEGGFEIQWGVFTGENATLIWTLLLQRAQKDNVKNEHGALTALLRAHIQRGLSYLASEKRIRSISDLVALGRTGR